MNNFTNNRWLSVITLFLLTANIVTLALLWTGKKNNTETAGMQPPPGTQVFEFITGELKLDSAQQQIYKALRDEHQAGVRPMYDSIRKAKDAFYSLLNRQNVTDTMIEAYSKKIGEMEQKRDVLNFRHFQKLRAICSKQQQIKFDAIIQNVLQRFAGPKRPPGPPTNGEMRNRRPPPPQE